jgi:hypothetical protein
MEKKGLLQGNLKEQGERQRRKAKDKRQKAKGKR